MSKNKVASKDKDKGGQLVIRIAKSERAAFIALCEELDTTAAREIRRFMREFIASKSENDAVEAEGKAAVVPSAPPKSDALESISPETAAAGDQGPQDNDAVDKPLTPIKPRKQVKS